MGERVTKKITVKSRKYAVLKTLIKLCLEEPQNILYINEEFLENKKISALGMDLIIEEYADLIVSRILEDNNTDFVLDLIKLCTGTRYGEHRFLAMLNSPLLKGIQYRHLAEKQEKEMKKVLRRKRNR